MNWRSITVVFLLGMSIGYWIRARYPAEKHNDQHLVETHMANQLINDSASKTRSEATENNKPHTHDWIAETQNILGGSSGFNDLNGPINKHYREWSQTDRNAALQSALNIKSTRYRPIALSSVVREWVKDDADSALNWLFSLPKDETLLTTVAILSWSVWDENFKGVRAYYDNMEDPVLKSELLSSFNLKKSSVNMSFEEHIEVYHWLGTVTSGYKYDSEVTGLVSTMAIVNPNMTAEFVLNMPMGRARNNSLDRLVSKWVQDDPDAAWSFVDSLDDPNDRREAIDGFRTLAYHDITFAANFVAKAKDPQLEEEIAKPIIHKWAKFDPSAAMIWSESLINKRTRQDSITTTFESWIQSDLNAALEYARKIENASSKEQLLANGFEAWAKSDPTTATKNLAQLPDDFDSATLKIYDRVAQAFSTRDPIGASEWIDNIINLQARDASITRLVYAIAEQDPESAFIWANSMSDSENRKNLSVFALEKLRNLDPVRAEELSPKTGTPIH